MNPLQAADPLPQHHEVHLREGLQGRPHHAVDQGRRRRHGQRDCDRADVHAAAGNHAERRGAPETGERGEGPEERAGEVGEKGQQPVEEAVAPQPQVPESIE